MSSVFVVMAYRWGQTNNHSYIVHAGTDREAAVAAAKDESEGRGLKYGIEVVAFPAGETIAYFSSNAEPKDAAGPHASADRVASEAVGSTVLLVYQAQTTSEPLAQMFAAKVDAGELPAWLAKMCEHELELARRMT